jgi:hypothetical protein
MDSSAAAVAGSDRLHGAVAAVDLDPGRLALLRLRDPHLEDAAVEAGADVLRRDPLRQFQRAGEPPEGPLDAVVPLLLLLMLRPALAGDGEDAVPSLGGLSR